MLKGAIFDLDGTLLDSMFIWDTIGEDYLRTLGKEPHENLKETFMMLTLEEAAEYYREHYGVTLSVKEIVDGVNAMVEDIYRTKVMSKSGVTDYLRWLKENGVKMCIATVTDRYLVEETLERLGIRHYFFEIFTCAEVGFGKDKPIIYRKALEHLGTAKEETCVFEDSLFALKTAKADGFHTVGVYDRHENRQDELKNLADYYIWDFADPILKNI
ncbi:MAG: HAD family phosphatase [Ruminococcaceae bacterium]|nr:HAD family phosphatase [Oscillospiraceae bacterium]